MKECLELEEEEKEDRGVGMSSIEDKVWEEHCRGHYGPKKVRKMLALWGIKVLVKIPKWDPHRWSHAACTQTYRISGFQHTLAPRHKKDKHAQNDYTISRSYIYSQVAHECNSL